MIKYLSIAVSLVGSLFIYLFYRTEKTLINELVKQVIAEETYMFLREIISTNVPLSSPLVYSLPGGLWVFCITLTSRPFFLRIKEQRISCEFLPLVFSIGLEIFQLLRITKGRFDPADICISILFWLLAISLFSRDREKQNILKSYNLKGTFCFLSYCIVYFAHVLD